MDEDLIQLERALAKAEPAMREAWLRLVQAMGVAVPFEELVQLLERGRIDEALSRTLASTPSFGAARTRQVIEAANDVARQIGRALGGIIIEFDQTNPFVVNALRTNQVQLVQGINAQQTAAIRESLNQAAQTGANPRETARLFRQSIGLTPNQVRAVGNFERELRSLDRNALNKLLRDKRFDPTIIRAIRDGRPLTEAQVQRMTGVYRQRYIKFRSEVIARTEALRSVHEGNDAMFRQAIRDGQVDPNNLTREWNTALDERVRGSHRAMHGQTRGVDEPFESGAGFSLMYPGDVNAPPEETIQCRCTVGTRMTSLSGVSGFEVLEL
jgi:hypothetical protein